MQTSNDLHRHASPVEKPHGLGYLNGVLWVGSWETNHVYAIDPQTWSIREEYAPPGKPYGIAAVGDSLRVVVSVGSEDDRYLYRLIPGRGFDLESKTACPDFTGSYLAARGSTLYLTQLSERRIVELSDGGTTKRAIALPSHCAGIGFGREGQLFMIAGDEELENLSFGTLNAGVAAPAFEAVMPLPDEARSIAYDGTQWWTCLRDADEIGRFS